MVVAVFAGTPVSTTIPDSNPCSPEAVTRGQFYHAVSGEPSKYVQCDIWGKAYIKTCPLGTQWHSDVVNCIATGDDKTDATTTTSQAVTTDGAGGNGYILYETKHHPVAASTLLDISALSNPCDSIGVRYLPHPQLTNRYFICVNQHPVLASCGYFYVWYQKWGRCVPARESTTTITTMTPTTTTTQPPTTTTRTTTTTTAPSSTTTTTGPSTTTMDSSVCLPENVRYHPYPGDETKYIECRLWLVISVHACPPSQVWYQLHQCCLPQTPTTTNTPATTTTPPISSSVTTSQMDTTTVEATTTKNFCLGADSRYFPYPPDAAKFIQCDAFGNMFLRFCGAAKVWDDTYKTCVGRNIISWPEEDKNDTMDDGGETTDDGQGDVTDGDVTLQVTCPQGYLWIIYTACCRVPVGLVVVHPICLGGFKWSAKLQMCVAELDDTNVSTTTTTTETPTTTTTLNPTTEQPDGNPCTPTSPLYQPHPYNNLRLLMCVSGAPYVLQCPYTTTTVCIWPPQNYEDTWITD